MKSESQNYLDAIDDGLQMRQSGKWAEVKLDYLRRYINTFETSMKGKWAHRNYIDLFSGPGKNKIRTTIRVILGSPLLALTTKYPFTGYYFADMESKFIEVLRERCFASPISDRIHCYPEDANKAVNNIIADINRLSPQSLNLAFLDPEGLELEWNTVSKLGKLRCDLIIHYSQQGISRYISQAFETDDETAVDRFFGTPEWREVYSRWYTKQRKFGLHRELIDFYKNRLQLLGYAEVKQTDEALIEPLMRNERRNTPLYRLIFASKNVLGDKLWQQIVRRDFYGQKQLF